MNQKDYLEYVGKTIDTLETLYKDRDYILERIALNGERKKDLIALDNIESRIAAFNIAMGSKSQETLCKVYNND